MKTCIIIDDDNFSRETLSDFLSEYKELTILKSIDDSQFAIKHIVIHKPDLVFLDINMPNKTGLNIMNEINELNISTKVIFVTAYKEYLMDALKKNAFDYLVKPLNKLELDEAIKRFFNKSSTNHIAPSSATSPDEKILITNAHRSLVLNPKDVVYIIADGCYTKINLTQNKSEVISKNLGKIENYFNSNTFFKISRSIIINIKYLTKIDRVKKIVYLSFENNNVELKASKEKIIDLESFVNRLKFHQGL